MHSSPNNELITRMLSRIVRRHLKNVHTLLNKHEVYAGQPPLMFTLAKQPGLSQNELARQLDITPATLTVMLRRMEKNGLVRRETDPRDQRISRIYLSDKGKDTLKVVRATMDKQEQQALDQFSSEDKDLLRKLLIKVQDNVYSDQSESNK